ncbi:exosome complex component CSL4 isoform X2 [Tripterygium wilfordii]|uniref:exosome complex component CSL4 isoform X2 n=1 Tax=Tripterygium wilfordii TaxID=458696 RepID=UPI0018F7FC08|nr:exosome complex component CSL4 isoform X2 [Tripterygium wilfordii]
MQETDKEVLVTPGEVLGKATQVKAGRGTYVAPHKGTAAVYASLTGFRRTISPPLDSSDQRPTVEVTGHKAHGVVPEPGCVVIARVTKVTARMASADIMCVGSKSVREKFTGIIRQQDVRATEIDRVDIHLSFRPGDILILLQSLTYFSCLSEMPGLIIYQLQRTSWVLCLLRAHQVQQWFR